MTIHTVYYLVCSICGKQYHFQNEYYFESIREARNLAKGSGWQYKKVENGTYWDFCSDHREGTVK